MVEKWVCMGVAGVIVGYVAFANMSVPSSTITEVNQSHSTVPLSTQSKQGSAAKRIVHDQEMQFGGQGQTSFRFEEGHKLYISIKNTGKQPVQYKLNSANGLDLQGSTSGFSSQTLQPGERHDLLFVKPEGQDEAANDSLKEMILKVSTDDGSQGSVKTFAYITL
ncbi:putative periplasmic lipoprotein [Paenibacillus sp. SEL1]